MILYVNGDSHSAGHDAFEVGLLPNAKANLDVSYGKLLADKLEFDFVCDALPGCSNDSIISRTVKYLENNTPNFIIIGWSTWERETWYYDNNEYNITASGVDSVHPKLQDQYKQWVIDQNKPEVQWHKEFTTHDKIWKLHNQLKHIPHLFFNCYSYFFYTINQNKPQYDWGGNYIDPYTQNSTYYFWLEQQGFRPSNPKYYHYGADAHQAWAEFLLPKVKNILTQNG